MGEGRARTRGQLGVTGTTHPVADSLRDRQEVKLPSNAYDGELKGSFHRCTKIQHVLPAQVRGLTKTQSWGLTPTQGTLRNQNGRGEAAALGVACTSRAGGL